MPGNILFSTNPWIAGHITATYRGGIHFVWCSEYYDPATALPGTAAAAVAPSSSAKGIFDTLRRDCRQEDTHSALIKGYRKTFRRLSTEWLADRSITASQRDEIVTLIKSSSWRIWRPFVYLIPRAPIVNAGRLLAVPLRHRAAVGPEFKIIDLAQHEFDAVEW